MPTLKVTEDPNWRPAAFDRVTDMHADVLAHTRADYVLIIAMFVDSDEVMHVVDGGTAPMPVGELYLSLGNAHEARRKHDA